ncbi:MAG: hypothetical protein ACJAZN_002352 [Planctomycetota bacterium]|jgi:hypothetical protein
MTRPDPDSPENPSGPASHYREADEKSYGNMSDRHWSKTRGERNADAIDYYRDRSHAPGVEEGGEARNYYCMECDGVIPWDDFKGDACPHCGAAIEGSARRYFNWVEIDRTPKSDRTATLIAAGIVTLVLVVVLTVAYWIFR